MPFSHGEVCNTCQVEVVEEPRTGILGNTRSFRRRMVPLFARVAIGSGRPHWGAKIAEFTAPRKFTYRRRL